jgi:hypothetical protein
MAHPQVTGIIRARVRGRPLRARLTSLEYEMIRKCRAGQALNVLQGSFDFDTMKVWGPERTIRAAVLRYLLTDCKKWRVHPKGVRLCGVRIAGQLDLEATTLTCPLRLEKCYLDSPEAVNLDHATVSLFALSGCQLSGITARNLVVTKDFELDGSTISGNVRLYSAHITGRLNCSGTQLTAGDNKSNTLNAERMTVGGSVFLNNNFRAVGGVRLYGAEISGSLDCSGARLEGGGDGGYALNAVRLTVGGTVFLSDAFSAVGAVSLQSAKITGSLDCTNARFEASGANEEAINTVGATVGGDLCLDDFVAVGQVWLSSASISHTFRWAPREKVNYLVNLNDATVGQLEDDWTGVRALANGHWPQDGLLNLDGFIYSRISGDNRARVDQRLAWVRSQYSRGCYKNRAFATQPYEQLANVYEQAGQDSEARTIAIARRRDLRDYGDLSRAGRVGNRLLDILIRFGYETWRAVFALAVVFGVAVAVICIAQHHGNLIVPLKEISGGHAAPTAMHCISPYPCFYPVGYAIDTVIPIINVHQAEFWGPNGQAPWGRGLVVFIWGCIILGWALVTLVVAGYTGLVRKSDAL